MVSTRHFTIGIIFPLEEEYLAAQNVLAAEESWLQGGETFYRIAGPLPAPAVGVVVGEMGQESAGIVAERLVHEFGVQLLVVVGICGALSKDLALGDVVIPNVVDLYSVGAKAVPEGTDKHKLVLAGEPFRTPRVLAEAVADLKRRPELRSTYDAWAASAGSRRRSLGLVHPAIRKFLADPPGVHQGHLASGNDVVAAAAYGEWLRTARDRSYLAVEMEAGGIANAAHRRLAPVPVLVLRGVSDFADERKVELDADSDHWPAGAWRKYAVQNTTALLPVLLRDRRLADLTARTSTAERSRPTLARCRAISRDTLARLGRRRTAYPLDLSIAELYEEDLLIETPTKAGRRKPDITAADLAVQLRRGESSLLLGEPGAGKTVALYQVAQACIAQGLLPIVVRARDLGRLKDDLDIANLRPNARRRVALLIDGLDEALGEWHGATGVGTQFVTASGAVPVAATSRSREFHASGELQATLASFQRLYHLQPWRAAVEFSAFLDKLAAAGRPAPSGLRERVNRSAGLRRLASRPLYARMLTYVGEDDGLRITNAPALYGAYLGRLARVTDHLLEEQGLTSLLSAMDLWKQIAWSLHRRGAQPSEPALAFDMLDELVADLPSPPAQRILLGYLFDVTEQAGRHQLDFVHHSFYEYLLAAAVLDALLDSTEPSAAADALGHDLSREVRHHLVMQMRAGYGTLLAGRLASAYELVASDGLSAGDQRLAAANLTTYLLSRLSRDTKGLLRELLEREELLFLRLALTWALCHVGEAPALHDFVRECEEDDWRTHVRGYVLYYYGDLPRDSGPPYRDTPPYAPCPLSRRRVLAMMSERSYRRAIPVERRYVDVYSYLDLFDVRALMPTSREHRSLQRLTSHILADLEDPAVGRLLREKARAVLG